MALSIEQIMAVTYPLTMKNWADTANEWAANLLTELERQGALIKVSTDEKKEWPENG